jgi:chromosome segregation ATPase
MGAMAMENRVSKLEGEIHDVRIELTDFKTRLAVAESNIQDIKADLTSIKDNTNWIIRLIISAIILAIMGFVAQGGLKIG